MNDSITLLFSLGTAGTLLLFISVIMLQVRGQNRLLKERERAQLAEIEHQKQLLNAVITSQEAERKRIGQDLHDDIGAALSGLRLSVDLYEPPAAAREQYQQFNQNCKSSIDAIIADLRNIAHNLSPAMLGLHGLVAALEKQLTYINAGSTLQAVINNNANEVLQSLDLSTATALYRVLEELLNNTIKHAGASTITIDFSIKDDHLLISYADNGKGLPPDVETLNKGIGMQNIESRLAMIKADYKIQSGKPGFNIAIQLPLKKGVLNA